MGVPSGRTRRLDRIKLARHQDRELTGTADAAGNARRFGARAKINVGSRGPDDRRAGILREHETAEFRSRFLVGNREIGGNEEGCAVGMQRAIDGN